MIRLIITLALIAITTEYVLAQGEANSLKGVSFRERIVTGGGFGLGFGNTQDYVSLSPVIGYQLTAKILAGTGVTYRYTKFKLTSPALTLNDYGFNPFARYNFYKTFFAQAEYEHLNYEFPLSTIETTRKSFNSFLAGGGLIQPLSEKVSLYFMALYNFSYVDPTPGEYSAYNSPWVIRAGFNVGNFSF